ncbi:hypothetical protein VB636_10050 [Paracoccus sp. APAP_BH8]|uniref:hypothetical protein n=1 Tax=Paracoccus sp. APAP_BH8 TaxID=3110237 RepID=UPI002FD80B4C
MADAGAVMTGFAFGEVLAKIAPDAAHGWQTVSASDLPFAEGENPPLALDRAGLARVRDAFAEAAPRPA